MTKKIPYLNLVAWFLIIVVLHMMQQFRLFDTDNWTIHPDNGIISIITGTFLHTSWNHMTSNLSGILVGTSVIQWFYKKSYWSVILWGVLVPSTLMYLLPGRPTLGISGLVYAVIWFPICRGLMSRDTHRFYAAVVMLIFFGASFKSAFPMDAASSIAWQAHAAGMVVGFFLALWSRIARPIKS